MSRGTATGFACLLAAVMCGFAGAPAKEEGGPAPRREVARPDGKAADATKKVQVFILMGQSNMVGMGDLSGGSTPWRTILQNLVLSVYEGAYSPDTDYDTATPVSTTALTNVSQVASASAANPKGTFVLRGQIQMAASSTCEFSPGYHSPNIMVVDGVEVYREEPGKAAVRKPFTFEAGKAYPFRVTYLGRPHESGWYTRLDVPGTLHSLVKFQKHYPYLLDEAGEWAARKDVYYYDAREKHGAPLSATANNGKSIGPELGFGFVMGQVLDEPVLILKSCIGNRSLGWDLLPPGSRRYEAEVTDRSGNKLRKVFAGYKEAPDSWDMDPAKGLETPPPPFVDKRTGKPIEWYAGKQYDDDMANAKAALENLARVYPDYQGQGYEIAGFVWWQGHKDQNPVHAGRYETNLVNLIRTLRKDYHAPKAKFVLATIAFDGWKLAEPGLTIANAQLAVGDLKKHPEFAGNVKCIEARDFWRDADVSPKAQGYHYNRNAGTYMDVGLSLGWAMADLLGK